MAETGRSAGSDFGSRQQQPSSSAYRQQTMSDNVEMDNLSRAAANPDTIASTSNGESNAHQPFSDKDTSIPTTPEVPSAKALGKAVATNPEQDPLTIDPADSSPGSSAKDGGLMVDIMLIVTASNSRHPFKINEKYLTKRNVTVMGKTDDGQMDPFSITVYTLKELILRDWRKEWEDAPREPSSIRLIRLGKMLEDRQTLAQSNFVRTAANVIHMTVKPQDLVDDEDAAKRVKESGQGGGRSGCCVVL